VATEAKLAAFDLRSRRTLWQIVPVPGAAAIRHLAMLDGVIYGTTDTGTLFVVNPKTRAVLTTEPIASDDEIALAVKNGAVYGASHQQLVRIDPNTYRVQVVVDGLNAEPQAYPQLVNGTHSSALYTFTGRDLLQVDLSHG
jgi:outer membrane protein assembly factor BamB